MRSLPRFAFAALLAASLVPFVAASAAAAATSAADAAASNEARCPLPLHECLERFSHMRERPWLGAWMSPVDSTSDVRLIERVYPGGPAERAGLAPGDRLEAIGGRAPATFFAGKAGWKTGDRVALTVGRGGRAIRLEWTFKSIPDDVLAELLGAHVVAAHMAYGDFGESGEHRH